MATLANLAVSLTARIGSFEKGFTKAQKIASRFTRDLRGQVATISKYGSMVTGLAVGGFSYLVKQQFEAMDSVAELSGTLGLSAAQLVGYQHGLSLAGGSAEGFNKMVTKMNRSVADSQNGLQTTVREFASVGVQVKDLIGLSTDERIKLLADRYLSIGDAAQRASFLMTIFGRGAVSMGNLFSQGAKGLVEVQEEARRLNLTFSELDAQRIMLANDAFDRLKASVVGAARVMAVQLAPFILYASEKVVELGSNGNLMGRAVVNAFNQILRAVGRLADYLELVKAIWYSFESAIEGTVGILLRFARVSMIALKPFAYFFPSIANGFQLLDDMISGFERNASDSFGKAGESFGKFLDKTHSKDIMVMFDQSKPVRIRPLRVLRPQHGGCNMSLLCLTS